MRTERPEPVLPARNLDETRAFYESSGSFRGSGGVLHGTTRSFRAATLSFISSPSQNWHQAGTT